MRVFRFIWALIKHIFLGERVSEEIYDHRMSICDSCDKKQNDTCGVCGCYVEYKSRWITEECPLKKW